jgi:hypothetical protein
MGNITVTNTKLTAFNAFKVLAANAADLTTDATAQKFVFTPTGKDNHALILAESASADKLEVTITGGDGPFALATTVTADAIDAAGLFALQIETGRYMQSDGTIEISFKPPTGKDLTNDNALKVYVCEMLPN